MSKMDDLYRTPHGFVHEFAPSMFKINGMGHHSSQKSNESQYKSGAKVAKSRNKETARAAMCAPGGFMSFRLYRNDEGAAKAAYQDIFSHSLNKNAALVRNRRFGSFS